MGDPLPRDCRPPTGSRGILHSLFCCVCRDDGEPLPNGAIPKHTPVQYLLPEVKAQDSDKICVVIDLDKTLVHSSFKPVNNADFIIPVEIDGVVHQVYVLKRPHVDEFLQRMGELFELKDPQVIQKEICSQLAAAYAPGTRETSHPFQVGDCSYIQ